MCINIAIFDLELINTSLFPKKLKYFLTNSSSISELTLSTYKIDILVLNC
jgi:hypothetical protein